jgi:hypothetical protein
MVRQNQSRGNIEQLAPLTRDLPADEQAALLLDLAKRFHRAGRSDVALATLDGLIRRQTDDMFSHAAATKRIRLGASAEMQHMLAGQATQSASPIATAMPLSPDGGKDNTVELAGAAVTTTLSPQGGGRLVCGALAKRLPPSIRSLAWLQMTVASEQSQGASRVDRGRIYDRLQKRMSSADWLRCAATEAWLADPAPDPKQAPPALLQRVGRAAAPPLLDGALDESLWSAALTLTLAPTVPGGGTTSAQVRVARDDEYLYLAIQCQRAITAPQPGGGFKKGADPLRQRVRPLFETASSEPVETARRQRDTDLSAHDRVDFFIDVNRDYSSGWRLTIDERGWANELCCEDPSWNPPWYIAQSSSDQQWTIEAAMPLAELVPTGAENEAWLFGVRRTMPRIGWQSWPSTYDGPPRPSITAAKVSSDSPGGRSYVAALPWQRCGYLMTGDVTRQSP